MPCHRHVGFLDRNRFVKHCGCFCEEQETVHGAIFARKKGVGLCVRSTRKFHRARMIAILLVVVVVVVAEQEGPIRFGCAFGLSLGNVERDFSLQGTVRFLHGGADRNLVRPRSLQKCLDFLGPRRGHTRSHPLSEDEFMVETRWKLVVWLFQRDQLMAQESKGVDVGLQVIFFATSTLGTHVAWGSHSLGQQESLIGCG
jgi:hypothetical protein